MYMEISGMGLSTTVLANSSPQSAVGLMMLNKAMDADQVNGDLMTQMLERSVNPMVGQNIDIRL